MAKSHLQSSVAIVVMGLIIAILRTPPRAVGAEFRTFVDNYCAECHDGHEAEGGLDLTRFSDDSDVMKDRSVWRAVYEKLESQQMPPPKQKTQPSDEQRTVILNWIEEIASHPDPKLGALDPGKPVIRRLTRLEYNNAIRDLFELDVDIFMFPERLPIVDKSYFQPATGKLDGPLRVSMREYGGKYPVLCPQLGLPGDNRAEHGYRNRGDAMDVSPLLLEKYLEAARAIVYSPDLPIRSSIAADLFGIDPKARQALVAARQGKQAMQKGDLNFPAAGVFAPELQANEKTNGSVNNDAQKFREDLQAGFTNSISGVFDAGDAFTGVSVVPGKGGLLRVPFAGGAKTLTINPNANLWIVGFSTAEATSGGKLFSNHMKAEKKFELTFKLEDADEEECIERLAVCVLGRKKESGTVTLTAKFTDDTETVVAVDVAEGPSGTQFASFTSFPGESIKSLLVDGSKFSGDYVLLDDLGFITNGQPRPTKAVDRSAIQRQDDKTSRSVRDAFVPSTTESQRGFAERITTIVPPRERLIKFISRAFRREVTADEAHPFVSILTEAIHQKQSEADVMKAALTAVLVSPQFLFVEANGATSDKPVVPLEDSELATRLALFLWSSTPDDELLQLAKVGRLHDPHVLEHETRRMLRDPKSCELSESFATQWLRLDQLYTSKPDRDLFPSFYAGPQGKSTLHGAMLTEALLLFETVHVEDRSILDFINAEYSWLNPGLAKLYGIPFKSETEESMAASDTTRELKTKKDEPGWRRVALPDAQRGGFITMAAPLVVTSLPFRTSPVKRGAWLLETIFYRPPTEPKVAFTIENDTKEAAQQMSIRQKFEAHRNKEACYSCHVRLDPPGFALERFDPIGQWRETDGNQLVEAKGDWQGKPFDGPAEFKMILKENPHEFTRGFIEHMLSYALGRELQIFDMPTVLEIQKSAKADGWKFSRIVVELAKSHPFTHTRSK
jgi:Protein of unknown function (DUF1592)/Protein of unknown function (DUF1588)/Protein of unknown function (DUF1585)/Protein of unknown function (DUF1595)/Protein of unknown function (DUF1587)/Planctomycete cytochrome C